MMNFSNSMKPPHKRRGTYWRDLVLGFIVGALVALLIGLAVSKITTTAKADQDFSAEPPRRFVPIVDGTAFTGGNPNRGSRHNSTPNIIPGYGLLCL